ncbi:thiol:disulfide interchange protein DsbD [Pedobacter westerhofensis]|uniref:Thiol:disulfide interchange protein DsbD n=1 Tax=Pedobacter westerhofensis TaxID=425512 RepID=A0A521FHN7_9SPHI|nr:cytochrome c biogenesis protein CcdA [Pedobacter westerhofensis]SMO95494.1 thiol:disulfide interchange protein DsbD [Pedobacter westerhofensis]
MKTFKTSIYILILGFLLIVLPQQHSFAQAADTAGITFTEITDPSQEAAGSAAAAAKSPAAVNLPAAVQAKKAVHATASKTGDGNGTKLNMEKPAQQSLWGIFITGFVGGLAAILMPCIFPMLPLTVSFFTKGSEKGQAFGRAALYGVFIILIYVVLGLLVTILFGADALNSLSTNGIFNFFFFLMLVAFATSFLGAFEITLPSSWVNKMDANSDKGGIAGLFFMAGTLALVSFSCTGPIIGTLLVQAATSGALLGPATGMFGFSLALAIPFVLFALFPSTLNALPKSGGWLNSVKVVLGFLELAFALKFLSNVDLAYHWEWFDRELFLVLWIVIFAMMGFYLLGKLRFSHDSTLPFISVPRLLLAIIVLAFTVYMIPGLWGAPLKSISAFLPPQDTQDFDLYTPTLIPGAGNTGLNPASTNSGPHKYADIFHAPLKLDAFFDYDEGMAYAKKVNKPVLIDFTGHACVNCRQMEANVWPDKEVYQMLSNDFVLIQLYVDDKTELAQEDIVTTPQGKVLNTIGKKWSDLQASKFQANSQPFYVLLHPLTARLLAAPQGADDEAANYITFLKSGLKAFHQ